MNINSTHTMTKQELIDNLISINLENVGNDTFMCTFDNGNMLTVVLWDYEVWITMGYDNEYAVTDIDLSFENAWNDIRTLWRFN